MREPGSWTWDVTGFRARAYKGGLDPLKSFGLLHTALCSVIGIRRDYRPWAIFLNQCQPLSLIRSLSKIFARRGEGC